MRQCRCSNCDPQGAARILRLLARTASSDFDNLLNAHPTDLEDVALLQFPKTSVKRKFSSNLPLVCKSQDPIRVSVPMVDLAVSLIGNFERLFAITYPKDCDIEASSIFDQEEAWQVVKNVSAVQNGEFLRLILGGESLPGLYDMILTCIKDWYESKVYIDHLQELKDTQVVLDQEILNDELIEEDHWERSRLKTLERELKAQRIQAAKQVRLEKQAERLRITEELKDRRRREQGFK